MDRNAAGHITKCCRALACGGRTVCSPHLQVMEQGTGQRAASPEAKAPSQPPPGGLQVTKLQNQAGPRDKSLHCGT